MAGEGHPRCIKARRHRALVPACARATGNTRVHEATWPRHAAIAALVDILVEMHLRAHRAHLHVIEFQHRGLPHAHILIILAPEHRLHSVDDIDACVTAELPIKPTRASFATDREYEKACAEWKELTELVCEHMQHGPCGRDDPKAACMQEDGTCKRQYPPKPFLAETKKPDGKMAAAAAAAHRLHRQRDERHGA